MSRLQCLVLLCSWFWLGQCNAAAKNTHSFVVSTHPIYLIAKAVTKGVEQPQLLLGNQSGHDVQLSPQQKKMLQNAELVLWLGKQHEAPLQKILQRHAYAVALLDSQIVLQLPLRTPRAQSIERTLDSHIWLEPNNAIRIAYFIAALRSQQHPQRKAQYWQNARQFSQQLLAVAKRFDNSGNVQPYWAMHDAYQYVERALNIKMVGALTEDPHLPVTASQLKYLNDNRARPRMCLLVEADTNQNTLLRLQPVQVQVVNESLSLDQDFVSAWGKLAQQISQCVQATL